MRPAPRWTAISPSQTAQLARVDTDQVAGMLDDAVVAHQRLTVVEARYDRQLETNRFVLQPRFDGTASCWGQGDREAAALLAEALHAEADAPQTTPCPTHHDHEGHGEGADVLHGARGGGASLAPMG